ncbi:MAG TPA: glycosyltransferase, partial [Bauldia sp.]|nr:glycosyltransferase [Bauldia sp.]
KGWGSREGVRAEVWVTSAEPLEWAPPADEAAGDCEDDAAFAARARRLGLSFVPAVDLAESAEPFSLAAIRDGTFAKSAAGGRMAYVAPPESRMAEIQRWLAASPAARPWLRVASPRAIRAALTKLWSARLLADAVGHLAGRHPRLSARRVATAGQGLFWFVVAALMVVAAARHPEALLVAVNLVGALFFFGISTLRFVAAGRIRHSAPLAEPSPSGMAPEDRLPVYTVLVPLYREAHLVDELVASLDALDWPRRRLDIKLLVESVDPETVAAVTRAVRDRPAFEVLVVPQGGPRTKPKALSYALPLARGEYVTVYDAEDRPQPRQLREAHAIFAASSPDVACVQASLAIDNGARGWLPLMFTIEYAALFDGLLPLLAAARMPLPLGGTSNHFRRVALEAVGGWDPFNVTEDADLGLRLARFGYRAVTADLATHEDAPVGFRAWFNQRTRWYKGWGQTWLVHTRSPFRLVRQLGVRGLAGFLLIGTGLIVTSLVYPVYIATLAAAATNPAALWGEGDLGAAAILGVNLFNLVAGYVAMAVLSARALRRRGRIAPVRSYLLLPLYWLLMSLAAYRAAFELLLRPHHWAKTPHARHIGQ